MRRFRASLTTLFAAAIAAVALQTGVAVAATWSASHALGGQFTSDPAAVVAANGRLVAFGRGLNGHIWTRQQNPDYTWGGWYDLGAPAAGVQGGPDAVKAANGALVIFVRGHDNQIHHFWQTST